MVLVENSMHIFLIISGQIAESKKKEFEQTFRLAFSVKTEDCLVCNLSADTSKNGYYHFFPCGRVTRPLKILWSQRNMN